MSSDKEPRPSPTVTDIDDAEISAAYSASASRFFEKADNFDFGARLMSRVLENVESGAKIPLSEEDLMTLIAQTANLDDMVEAVSSAKDDMVEAAASNNRMGSDSIATAREYSGLAS